MVGKLFEGVSRLFALKQQVELHSAAITEIRGQLKETSTQLLDLREEVRVNKEREAREREVLMLRLENTLLKFERRLSPGKPASEEN